MKHILLALVIPWSLLVAPLPALAQSPELMAAYRQYEALEAQGKYAEAEPFARKALELGDAEFGTDHASYALLLNNLAILYESQGRYGEAEPFHKRAPWRRSSQVGGAVKHPISVAGHHSLDACRCAGLGRGDGIRCESVGCCLRLT